MPPRLILVIIIASIGFLFDTYELLMTPLVAPAAIAELLHVPLTNPLVSLWVGRLLWISAVCGGVFGLLGGWLIDRLGRKTVMAASIFVYALSPFFAAYSQSLGAFVFFRCTTFIGVCVEFIAAITWLAELFGDPRQRARWLGLTQAVASLGGVCVTAVNALPLASILGFITPHLPGPHTPDSLAWRCLLSTGLLPAIPIALLLPFVPESQVWKQKRLSGALRRPSFGQLFSPQLRRVTLVTALLSACAYAIAFGTLQVTVSSGVPALPQLAETAKKLGPLMGQARKLNTDLNATTDPAQRPPLLEKIKANALQLKPLNAEVKEVRTRVQFFQEMGGLLGRIALAVLVIVGLSRLTTLRLFQVPSVVVLPITYFVLLPKGDPFFWAYGLCGFLTVAQFSFFGEYLPKVFPLHLRGTGGSFATNVGGRMIGTSASLVTTAVIAPMLAGGVDLVKPIHVLTAAGYLGTGVAVLALIIGFFLPDPKLLLEEAEAEPTQAAAGQAGTAD